MLLDATVFSMRIETYQLGRDGGVDKDGFEGNLVSNFTSGTKWGQARASETPLVRELIEWE